MLLRKEADFIRKEFLGISKMTDVTKRWKRARRLIRYVKKITNGYLPEGFDNAVYSIAWGDGQIFRRKRAAEVGGKLERYFRVVNWEEVRC